MVASDLYNEPDTYTANLKTNPKLKLLLQIFEVYSYIHVKNALIRPDRAWWPLMKIQSKTLIILV